MLVHCTIYTEAWRSIPIEDSASQIRLWIFCFGHLCLVLIPFFFRLTLQVVIMQDQCLALEHWMPICAIIWRRLRRTCCYDRWDVLEKCIHVGRGNERLQLSGTTLFWWNSVTLCQGPRNDLSEWYDDTMQSMFIISISIDPWIMDGLDAVNCSKKKICAQAIMQNLNGCLDLRLLSRDQAEY
jgi:hypothetical protein